MAKHEAVTTQSQHPWRATVRTVLAFVIALAAMADPIYTAISGGDPAAATGFAGVTLGIAGAITRVMALPVVEAFLQRFLPWLAAKSRKEEPLEAGTDINDLPEAKTVYRRDHGLRNRSMNFQLGEDEGNN